MTNRSFTAEAAGEHPAALEKDALAQARAFFGAGWDLEIDSYTAKLEHKGYALGNGTRLRDQFSARVRITATIAPVPETPRRLRWLAH